jgi:hypothetical protein
MTTLEFPYGGALRKRFRSGKLITEWARRYPRLFDERDVQIANNQKRYHFFEWLAAVLLYESTGYLSLIEKYETESHVRKIRLFRKTVPPHVYDFVIANRVGAPDLFAYAPDYSDWFFCEIKGARDRLRSHQISCCNTLEKISGRKVRLLILKEIRL